jgi:hypothetical protein
MSYKIIIESHQASIPAKIEGSHTAEIAQAIINYGKLRNAAAEIKEEIALQISMARETGEALDIDFIRTTMKAAEFAPQRISELLAEFGLQRGKAASKTSKGAQVKAENLLAKLLPIVKANVKGLSQTERAAVIHRLTLALKAEFSK